MRPLANAVSANVTLSLGLISLPVFVHGAVTEDDTQSLRTVCTNEHAPTPIKGVYRCPECSSEDGATFSKAREEGGGVFTVVPPQVIEQAQAAGDPFKKSISLTVHPAREVSSVLLPSGKSYYLAIRTDSMRRPYTLLSRLIDTRPDLAFMCKFTLRSSTSIFQLTTAGEGTLVLRQMADAALVRSHPVIEFVEPSERDLELATQIIEMETVPFLEVEHGTGKSAIIAEFAAAHAGQEPAALPGPKAVVTDMTDVLESMLAGIKKSKKSSRPSTVKKAS
jgi:non-homologous end joining protein Ku